MTISEIEKAIQHLPAPQVDELAAWLEVYRSKRSSPLTAEAWLEQSRGAARPGASTAEVISLTRGEE